MPCLAVGLKESVREGFGLLFRREPCEQVGMPAADFIFLESLGNFRNERQQRQPRINVTLALAALVGKGSNVVAGEFQEPPIAARFLVRVNVFALAVLNDLDFKRLRVAQLQHAGRNLNQLRDLRRAVASCARDDLEALTLRAHGDRLNEAVRADTFRKLNQAGRLEGATRVCGGFVKGRKGKNPVL